MTRLKLLTATILSFGMVMCTVDSSACGTCGCSLNTEWSNQGYSYGTGLHADLRFDYFNQNQLREGLHKVDRSIISFPNDREIQEKTINRNTTLTLGYSPNQSWGVEVVVPAYNRTHSTIAGGEEAVSSSESTGIGDVRVIGRYQGFSTDNSFGIEVGAKLPTGRTDDTFASGPQAGNLIDRGLQLGTGTTDLLIGAYKFGSLSPTWGYFTHALAQAALNSKDEFRPGNALNVSAGVHYTGYTAVTPNLQINLRAENRESGAHADIENSGATLIYLSPGIVGNISHDFQVFAFVQVPVYQRVTGYQLEPQYLISAGLHYNL